MEGRLSEIGFIFFLGVEKHIRTLHIVVGDLSIFHLFSLFGFDRSWANNAEGRMHIFVLGLQLIELWIFFFLFEKRGEQSFLPLTEGVDTKLCKYLDKQLHIFRLKDESAEASSSANQSSCIMKRSSDSTVKWKSTKLSPIDRGDAVPSIRVRFNDTRPSKVEKLNFKKENQLIVWQREMGQYILEINVLRFKLI